MPVGFNSPARNLFLLGSTGAQIVTNFFRRIDQSAGTDGVYRPDEIKFNVPDQKFLLAGSDETSSSKGKGWFEKRTAEGVLDWLVEVQSTQTNINTTLRALEIDSLNNLIVCGKTGTVPWIAKYTNGGVISWQVTSNTSGLEYTGIAVDSSNNIYACGSTSTRAYIERVDGTGSYSWGKYSSTTAGAITFFKCDANSRGEVVAVGKIEDTIKDKGYIAKVNTATGALLWDRTIEDPRLATSSSYWQTECTDVYIDSKDQIYVVGTIRDTVANLSKGFLIKYSPEGNIVWQKETKLDRNFEFYGVRSDGETQQTVVLGRFRYNNDDFILLNKYSQDGTLLWSRTLFSSLDQTISNVSLDADSSFYYMLFTDETENLATGEPDTYTFGKVSTSGNGFGAFQYSSGGINYDYTILNITDNVGRLSDGSVRNDNSDFIAYPFEANKILFDDLATQIANKKVQVDEAGTYSDPTYNITTGYPRISKDAIVYDANLVLNYDFNNPACYRLGQGLTINNLSSSNFNANIFTAAFNFYTPPVKFFEDGGGGNFQISSNINTTLNGGTMEAWVYFDAVNQNQGFFHIGPGGAGPYINFYSPGNTQQKLRWEVIGNTAQPYTTILSNTNLVIGQWYHFIGTFNGTNTTSLYVNGSLDIQQTNMTNQPTSVNSTVDIGNYAGSINGRISELRFYNRALSAQEVSQNFNATRGKYGV
jgi:hypothetical protein